MDSWRLIFFSLIFVSASKSCSTNPAAKLYKYNSKLSSNSQTFIYGYLNMQATDLPDLRAVNKSSCITTSALSVSEPIQIQTAGIDSIQDETIKILRQQLVDDALEGNLSSVKNVLQDFYDLYPGYDHINQLYLHENAGVSRTLLHFAVISSNTDFIDFLLETKEVNHDIRDSYEYSALEVSNSEGLMDMTHYLLNSFKKCVYSRFLNYSTIVHYAAAHNRVDILQSVKDAEFYTFWKESFKTSPLEIALQTGNLNAAEFLIRHGACSQASNIKSIYLDALKKFVLQSKNTSMKVLSLLVFMIFNFSGLVYLKSENGFDFMCAAIANHNATVVQSIFESGFQASEVYYSYDLYLFALNHFDDIVLGLVRNHLNN